MAQTQTKTRQNARNTVASFVDALSAPTLLKLALALQRGKADPERLACKVLEVADDERQARALRAGEREQGAVVGRVGGLERRNILFSRC